MIDIIPISHPADLDAAFAIRRQVFVEEQHVSADEEYDEFETVSTHFLARIDKSPVGTARWRYTANGVKLERFAVLKAYRSRGVAKALVRAVLTDVFRQSPESTGQVYLHAQLTAMPLYAGFGFVAVGPVFDEAGIEHQKMVLPRRSADAVDSPGRSAVVRHSDAVDSPGSAHPIQ